MNKTMTLFMIFISLSFFPISSMGGERRGAEIVIHKKNGENIGGELIAVKKKVLLVLASGTLSEPDIPVDLGEMRDIKIIKPTKVLKGMGYGLAMGAVFGAISGSMAPRTSTTHSAGEFAAGGALAGVIFGAPVGAIFGWMAGFDKAMQIENRPEKEINKIILELSRLARIQGIQ